MRKLCALLLLALVGLHLPGWGAVVHACQMFGRVEVSVPSAEGAHTGCCPGTHTDASHTDATLSAPSCCTTQTLSGGGEPLDRPEPVAFVALALPLAGPGVAFVCELPQHVPAAQCRACAPRPPARLLYQTFRL